MNKIRGLKTFAFAILLAVTSILSNPEMQEFIGTHVPEAGVTLSGILIILRVITNGPIFASMRNLIQPK